MKPKTQQTKIKNKLQKPSTTIVQKQIETEPLTTESVERMVELLESYPNPNDKQNPDIIYQIIRKGLETFPKIQLCQLLVTIVSDPKFNSNSERTLKNVFRIIFGAYKIQISPILLIQILSLTAKDDRSPLDHEADDLGLFLNFTTSERKTLYSLRPFLAHLML